MEILATIIAIISSAVLGFFTYCVIVLNECINKNGLRYHWFDEEGDE